MNKACVMIATAAFALTAGIFGTATKALAAGSCDYVCHWFPVGANIDGECDGTAYEKLCKCFEEIKAQHCASVEQGGAGCSNVTVRYVVDGYNQQIKHTYACSNLNKCEDLYTYPSSCQTSNSNTLPPIE